MEDSLASWQSGVRHLAEELHQILERANDAYSQYKQGSQWEKRQLVDSLTSNRFVDRKTIAITLQTPFCHIANRRKLQSGSPKRDIGRTWQGLLAHLITLIHTGDTQRRPAT